MSFAARGDKGKQVRNWQLFLKRQGFMIRGDSLTHAIDEVFGPFTEQETKRFQKKAGLKETGIVDDDTLKVAKELGFEAQAD
jgi:peptidoglycan hydrolase-like protein with peptidoglycan-binding domain